MVKKDRKLRAAEYNAGVLKAAIDSLGVAWNELSGLHGDDASVERLRIEGILLDLNSRRVRIAAEHGLAISEPEVLASLKERRR